MGFARNVASKVVFMDEGVIAAQGAPQDVLENPANQRLREFSAAFCRKISPLRSRAGTNGAARPSQ